jgi:hypothetical protein
MPLSFLIFTANNNTSSIREALASRAGLREVDATAAAAADSWAANIVWKPTWTRLRPAPASAQWARGHALPLKRSVINHWRAVEPLCTKDAFFDTMRSFYDFSGRDYTDVLPMTFTVTPAAGRAPDAWSGWPEFDAAARAAAQVGETLWIVKPVGENRGIGIEVVRSAAAAAELLAARARASALGARPMVVQKYLERPLLSPDGRKFDLRVWALVLDSGCVWLHAPGYVRTSSDAFSLAADSRLAHLTNYCQQVKGPAFGAHEEGNTVRWETLERWLDGALPGVRARGRARGALAAARSGAEALWGPDGVWAQVRRAMGDAVSCMTVSTRGSGRAAAGAEQVAAAKRTCAAVRRTP